VEAERRDTLPIFLRKCSLQRAYILKSDASRDLLSGIDALINRQVFFTSGATQILEMHSVSELVRYAVKNCMLEP
jgi:hypothetical protein